MVVNTTYLYKKYKKINENENYILGFRRGLNKKIDQNAIFFESLHGKSVDGHIFSIIDQLETENNPLKIYIAVRDIEESKKKFEFYGIRNVNFVQHMSREYGYLLATCKYLINDNTFYPFFSKREGQKYYNFWHGTPLKTLGKDMEDITGYSNVQRNFFMTDALILSNDYTKDKMIKAHNIDYIYNGKVVVGPSPRNSFLFDENKAEQIRKENQWENKKIVMYMPTWRGVDGRVVSNDEKLFEDLTYLSSHVDDKTLIVFKGHTMQKNVDISRFTNVIPFPSEYELYHFLSSVDILITDYSSIMYDFASKNKKIILYVYDKEEYFSTRGVYENIDDYPFVQVNNVQSLASEINNSDQSENYDDFIERFCKHDSLDGAERITKYILNDIKSGAVVEHSLSNHKENIFIFCGGLWDNGITTALLNTLDTIDTSKRNYVLIFGKNKMQDKFKFRLQNLPENVQYYPIPGISINSLTERVIHKLSLTSTKPDNKFINKVMKTIYKREARRIFGDLKVDWFIHYTGFDRKYAELATYLECKTMMFVHTDMFEDYKNKKNYNQKVVYEAYRNTDKIVLVNENLKAGFEEQLPEVINKIKIMNNFLGEKRIKSLSKENFSSPLIDVRFHHVDSSNYVIDPIKKIHSLINDQSIPVEKNEVKQMYESYKMKLSMVFGDIVKETALTNDIITSLDEQSLLSDSFIEEFLNKNYPYRRDLIKKIQSLTMLDESQAIDFVNKKLIEDLSVKEASEQFPYALNVMDDYNVAVEERNN